MDQIKLLKGERDALEQKFKSGGDTEEISMYKIWQNNVYNKKLSNVQALTILCLWLVTLYWLMINGVLLRRSVWDLSEFTSNM